MGHAMKVSELEGTQLDYWVARAEGWTDFQGDGTNKGAFWYKDAEKAPFCDCWCKDSWTPSEDWSQGGPIIEREQIELLHISAEGHPDVWGVPKWLYGGDSVEFKAKGPTPLIAAMRAYVASIYGDEVPDS
jgi:hypothetical protein